MKQARSLHQIFQEDWGSLDMALQVRVRFKEWWAQKWAEQIKVYIQLGWAMIPIIVRGKIPLKSADNYRSKGAAGPYLSFEEA